MGGIKKQIWLVRLMRHVFSFRAIICCVLAWFALAATVHAQQSDQEIIRQLMQRLGESERRIQALEQKLGFASPVPAGETAADSPLASETQTGHPPGATNAEASGAGAQVPEAQGDEMQGHNMQIPGGGPVLNIRGFFDFNFGSGSIANPLIFPLVSNGCSVCGNPVTPAHTTFQAGEFDLFVTSKLSDHLSFVAEMVFGSDPTNGVGIDIERYQLDYHLNDYFSASAGRFHTAIGYYNTAFHHGNWFSTADGRPIMYLFEDSGGVLPVHAVGVSTTGLVPRTGALSLHWVAEIGNGRASDPGVKPVQNFYSDRNYKAFNLAVYIQPRWLEGLQIGGSFYHDRLIPTGLPRVNQRISSVYAVYNSATWEFLNEAVLLCNHLVGTPVTYSSPMAYTQLSRRFGLFRPYFRYQYVNDRVGDPVNVLQGLYYGPSIGLRFDYSKYAAFKLQYNHLLRGSLPSANGFNAQLAFTF